MTEKVYTLDTSVLFHDAELIFYLSEHEEVLFLAVIEELQRCRL